MTFDPVACAKEIGAEFKSGAVLSDCGTYRYRLWRQWDELAPVMVFVMMNPSTADATEDDRTIRRCMEFAHRERHGAIDVVNVFALRATDPAALSKHADPFGPENETYLLRARHRHGLSSLVVAWGKPKGGRRLAHHYRHAWACVSGQSPQCFDVNLDGSPKHPLYVAGDEPLKPWTGKPLSVLA